MELPQPWQVKREAFSSNTDGPESVSPPYRRHEQQNTAPFHCFLVFHPGQETNRANRLATGFWCLPPPAIPSMDDWPRCHPVMPGCQVCPRKPSAWEAKTRYDFYRLVPGRINAFAESKGGAASRIPGKGSRWMHGAPRAPAAHVLGNKHHWPPDFNIDAVCLTNSRTRGLVLVMRICLDCAPPRHSVQTAA
jgi:hypothetical protein